MGHRDALSEDFLHQARTEFDDPSIQPNEHTYNHALLEIEDILAASSRSLAEFDGFVLPPDTRPHGEDRSEPYVIREHRRLAARLQLSPPQLPPFNADQQAIFDAVCSSLEAPANQAKVTFVDGSGGCGKTHLFNAILDHVRYQGHIALAVAVSGTASLLLHGGRTAHSTFKIPLDVNDTSTCSFTPRSHTARLLKMAKLILWDEASMISRHVIETVDRSLRDLLRHDDPQLQHVPFGGKIILFGGDFRQVNYLYAIFSR